MEDKQRILTDEMKENLCAMKSYGLIAFLISAAYILEIVKKNRTIGYVAIVLVLVLVPFLITYILYVKNKSKYEIRYLISIGFLISQIFMMFTAKNELVFTYGILIMVAVSVYSDKQFAFLTAIIYNMSNIASVLYIFLAGKMTSERVVTSEIQVLLLLVLGYCLISVSNVSRSITNEHIKEVDEQKNNIAHILERVMKISEDMAKGIKKVGQKMDLLGESASMTSNAMEEVKSGNTETAESVQTQLVMTEEIQNRIEEVLQSFGDIAKNVEKTVKSVQLGSENMEQFNMQGQKARQTGQVALEKLSGLEKSAQNMQSIVDMINAVADQTGLLSLNASIEAARAGEAGRGFAVVASEISNLANQTQDATGNIEKLISELVNQLGEVSESINNLVEDNAKQKIVAMNTINNFSDIQKDCLEINDNTKTLSTHVKKLEKANKQIVESIQNISAISEEVSANSNETYETSKNNEVVVRDVADIVEYLQKRTNELGKEQ